MTEAELEGTRRRIHAIAYKIVRDNNLAENVVQEVQLRMFKNEEHLKTLNSLSSWIYVVTRNMAFTILDRQRRLPKLSVDVLHNVVHPQPHVDELIEQMEEDSNLVRLIQTLPEIYSTVLIWKHVLGLSYNQMAERSGLTNKTLEIRCVRARKLLQSKLPVVLKRGRKRDPAIA